MLAKDIKTASQLRSFIESAGTAPYFFSRPTMKCFGDTMANFGVRRVRFMGLGGGLETRYGFELYRKRPVKHGLQSSHFFCRDTFVPVHVDPDTVVIGWEE